MQNAQERSGLHYFALHYITLRWIAMICADQNAPRMQTAEEYITYTERLGCIILHFNAPRLQIALDSIALHCKLH